MAVAPKGCANWMKAAYDGAAESAADAGCDEWPAQPEAHAIDEGLR